MLAKINKKFRGDTLIEVLFAISIFSLVVVGAISVMNQGTNSSQRALEITLVRNEIDAQAQTLRFLNASYVASFGDNPLSVQAQEWQNISNSINIGGSISSFGGAGACEIPRTSFILDTKTATYSQYDAGHFELASTYSQVTYNNDDSLAKSSGIWIEATKTIGAANTNSIDFYIRACWDAPGQSVPVNLGTIVRLYEPK